MVSLDLPSAKGTRENDASRFMLTCNQIRCDASTRGLPCTNCIAFSVECKIHEPRRPTIYRPQTPNSGLGPENYQCDSTDSQNPKASALVATLQEAARSLRTQQSFGHVQSLDEQELDYLRQRGSFLLPPRQLCDQMINDYFAWVHPIVPCVDQTQFRRQYSENASSISVLLLQAVLLAGSKVCASPDLQDANGTTFSASSVFYRRAKAIYDANYENDATTIVQALTLMSWSEEGPEDVTKNVFYWSSLAIAVAQDAGFHQSLDGSDLSAAEKRIRKRIWWVLFTRDRSIARSIGRPVQIYADGISLEVISEEDFIEESGGNVVNYSLKEDQVQYFLAYLHLCHITGLVLSQEYNAKTKPGSQDALGYAHLNLALAEWLQDCPEELHWNKQHHSFLPALLQANYYTTLCLLERRQSGLPLDLAAAATDDIIYPSSNAALHAANQITSILEVLRANQELRHAPSFT